MPRFLTIYCALLMLVCSAGAYGQRATDYTIYHKTIAEAEKEVFIHHDSVRGMQLFNEVFTHYDFVFVDDCIEAFQLALVFRMEKYADAFIRKAIANGLKLDQLSLLSCGCTCNFFVEARKRVTVYDSFISSHRTALDKYAESCRGKYLARIDKNLWLSIIQRHVNEQMFKNHLEGLCIADSKQQAIEAQRNAYANVCEDNLRYIDSLAQAGIFPGERNMGLYSTDLIRELSLPYTVAQYTAMALAAHSLPRTTYVPVVTTEDYFAITPVYNILFHNSHSYDVLARHADGAIRAGYLHPREYLSLRYNGGKPRDTADPYLHPHKNRHTDTQQISELRARYYLPDYETEYQKHLFAHQHNIQLFFGFRNGTR